jgi:hypothetical protein
MFFSGIFFFSSQSAKQETFYKQEEELHTWNHQMLGRVYAQGTSRQGKELMLPN